MTTGCQWIGDGEGCTGIAVAGRSYCEQHLWRVYKQGTAVQRRKDKRRAAAVWDLESEFNQAVQELVEEGYNFDEDRWPAEAEA
jgi:hypothetical protein